MPAAGDADAVHCVHFVCNQLDLHRRAVNARLKEVQLPSIASRRARAPRKRQRVILLLFPKSPVHVWVCERDVIV